ncbi:hypothetical protein DPMN_100810 [Dreissena polymorpha]|uniref:Uncharacterized protein n=1 Tax=Dreissena polymorpha TaxID=45954 RepID=A0A9D4LJX6_DREPO|nr:hypothetical protein DPMN_100810 [Dreissena polymorpha]
MKGKYAGPYSIPAETLKTDVETSVELLYPLLSKIWEEEVIPKRVARVRPHQALKYRRPSFLLQKPKNHTVDFQHLFNLSLYTEYLPSFDFRGRSYNI